MSSTFPAYVAQGIEAGTHVQEFVPAQGANEPFIYGDFVVVSTGESGEAERCGADPTLIAGISEVDSEKNRLITPNGRVPLRIITGASVVIGLSSATTPVYATHVGNSYGITRASTGQWQLDVAKTTTSSRCKVVGIDIPSGTFFVVFHQNVLQFADLTVATA
jgi:hypothetical protein